MADVTRQLQAAISALQKQDLKIAIALCEQIISIAPDNADAFHINALALKNIGQLADAEKCFIRSLQLLPNQPAVLSNLANLLMNQGRVPEASSYFEKSTSLPGNNTEAWYNWAVWLNKYQSFDMALDIINRAITAGAKSPKLLIVQGSAYQNIEEFEQALSSFEQALAMQPNDHNILHHKASTYRMMLNPQKALQEFQKLLNMGHSYPELFFNIGCVYYDLHDMDMAIRNLKQAIELRPDYVAALEALSKLYWENDHTDEFLKVYDTSLSAYPDSIVLHYSYIALLMMAEQNQKAIQALEHAVERFNGEHRFLHALAVLKEKNGETNEVMSLLQQAVQQQPTNSRYQIDVANSYIEQESYSLALQHLNIAQKAAPLNQEILAYQGVCWRLTGDPKEEWLNNYQQLVSAEYLDVPPGYSDLTQFMAELRSALNSMHKTVNQPLDQSVKGGTQTVGRLLNDPRQVIQEFRRVLFERIQRYIEQLPDDPSHPFLSRNSREFRVTGSWSVRLKEGGFHTNHVHPLGWLSCCNYITVPKQISAADPNQAGWIKFGETSLGLGIREKIGKSICPQEGLSVLFPSFMWHGTNLFSSDQYRMTIPCDISPILRSLK